ncbi:Protein tyrosine kinase [Babesia microti strain RI]|uniref:non-specific serine/threonine protein kinase n=1 Tax=Babesia microti (strain RI) TaxID=1133968 RepID=A0A0K3AQ28_BABMR|nr:Protein tyrosine kinase [Babesia microti strain RI]CTQ40743.1 Protein tyrosine kinase [Babesia microti strain RI]|eukprot:XP_012648754.1 Protein tyrosine kinase [Babesia microti strain RI]
MVKLPLICCHSESHGLYRHVKFIGKGSYGTMTLARDSDDNLWVVKKIDLTQLGNREKKLCLTEIEIISNIHHPYIVEYRESFVEDGKLNIVMQYCAGGDLYKYISYQRKRGIPIKEERIVEWVSQILAAVKFLHQHHILHRDLKSLNILIDSDKRIRICDFGVSKVLKATLDSAQTMIGTPYYFSPELIEGHDYNWPSDIWALGCLVYELSTFKTPYDGAKGMKQLCHMIRTKEIPNLPDYYSDELNALYKSMLAYDYRLRLSASELLATPIIQKKLKEMLQRVESTLADGTTFADSNTVVNTSATGNSVVWGDTDEIQTAKEYMSVGSILANEVSSQMPQLPQMGDI